MSLINRETLLAEYDRIHVGPPGKARKLIEDAPTIEPERKTGKWIPDNNNYYEERYICSACKRSYKVDTCMGKPIWNYCPCGAKMEEGEK